MSELNNVARASVRGYFFLFLGMTSSTIIMALSTIIVARLLGPEDYGLFTIILVVPSLFVAFTDLGISPAIIKFSSHFHMEGKDRKAANLIKTGIFFKLLFTLIISLSLFIVSEEIATYILNRPGTGNLIRITLLSLLGQAVLSSVNSAFISLDKTEKSSILMNIHAIIKAVASPLLIIIGLGIAGAIIGQGLGLFFAATSGAAILLLRTCPRLRKNSMESENITLPQGLKMMISYGAPLYLSSIMVSASTQIQSVILALFTSNINIGNYRTAQNFTILMTLLASPIATILFPAFSKLNIEKDRSSLEKMFKLSVKYTSLIIIPVSIALALLSKNVVYILYGSKYQTAPSYLSLYMLIYLYTALGKNVIRPLFNSQGDTKTTFKINLINLAISIPLALILIPTQGVPGIIISILISRLSSTIYGLNQVRRIYHINIEWISSLKILIASFFSAIPVYILLKLPLITNPVESLVFGGTLYIIFILVLAPILGAINKEDIKNIEELTKELTLIYPIIRYILCVEKKALELNIRPFYSRARKNVDN